MTIPHPRATDVFLNFSWQAAHLDVPMDPVLPMEVCECQKHAPKHVRNRSLVQGSVMKLEEKNIRNCKSISLSMEVNTKVQKNTKLHGGIKLLGRGRRCDY